MQKANGHQAESGLICQTLEESLSRRPLTKDRGRRTQDPLPFKQAANAEFDVVTSNDKQENLNGKPSVASDLHFGVHSPYDPHRAKGENPEGAQPKPLKWRGPYSRVKTNRPKYADEHEGDPHGVSRESLIVAILIEDVAAETEDAKHNQNVPEREGSSDHSSAKP